MAVPGTHDKALRINLDAARYGTFAEIGAGQEVARWFFHVGGAAGTVAKTISAYDMAVSDAIYGPAERYVSRARLQAMLDHEWGLLLQRLEAARGPGTCFFVFADTVAAKSYSRHEEGHGWLGIRFQHVPRAEPSQVLLHARMWDAENARQQEALGILGVNLVHAAFYGHGDPGTFIGALMDGLTRDRMEVDMVKFSGPLFAAVDNRLLSLQLVEQRLTNAVLFAPDGEALEPAELLHHAPVLIERGSFRPVTTVMASMLSQAAAAMRADPRLGGRSPVVLAEMTLRNLLALGERVEHADFVARVDCLRALGLTVMVSNYSRFHSVTTYLRRYTREPIGIVIGIPALVQVLEEKHYADLDGGLLEALGRLLAGPVVLHVAPWRGEGGTVTAESFSPPPGLEHLYAHLLSRGSLRPLPGPEGIDIGLMPHDVLARIQAGDASWADHVPPAAAAVIRERKLFGCRGA